jgi:hypothetical protein
LSFPIHLHVFTDFSEYTDTSRIQPSRYWPCPFETYPPSPVPFTMTSVAFPKSIFSELAANLPRHACRTGESITMSSNRSWVSARITSFNGKISLTFLFLLLALPAFAAGGTCPSGANYTNPADPTGALVTLSSLGVNSCYYVAANGSDTNNGINESSPWLHSPGMQNCSGNCASVSNPAPGTGIIFRGGDTWHFGNSSASPYAGVVSGCSANNSVPAGWCLANMTNGTSSNPIYFGVDPGWPSSGWSRPIFSADNSFCNASTTGTMPDGATCTSATNSTYYSSGQGYFGQSGFYVSSCPYQVGGANNLVDLSNGKYEILDNLELSGLCLNSVGQPQSHNDFIRYGSADAPLTFENLYIHGASHVQFAGQNTSSNCTGSTVCTDMTAFEGSVPGAPPGETLVNNIVDFYGDSDPGGQRLTLGGFWNVAYNVFRGYTTAIPNTVHIFHDNLVEYFLEDGHSNLFETNDLTGTNPIYNNVFRHIENNVTSGGGVAFWWGPASGATDYFFNNLVYDVGPLEYFNMGGNALTQVKGNYVVFNNTFQSNANQPVLRCTGYTNGTIADTNNHYIDDDSSYILGPCSTLTSTTPLVQTNAQAASNVSMHFDQYTASETYGYSPVVSTNSTVVAGTNEYSGYCSALSTAGLNAAATACQSGTTYACAYNTSNHTVNCSAPTVVARPSSGAWDVGAYEFNAQNPPPNPPTGLSAVVN